MEDETEIWPVLYLEPDVWWKDNILIQLSLPLKKRTGECPMDFHLSNDIIMTVSVRLDSTFTFGLVFSTMCGLKSKWL